MSDGPEILTFTETMAGGFALGETDPDKGSIRGWRTPMTIRNAMRIPDLAAFYADAQHPAELAVKLDFEFYGEGLPTRNGVFNLFYRPHEDSRVKLMVYRFNFDHDGAEHFFLGQKFIYDGSPLARLTYETTHLYSRVHKGADDTGEVVGAGVLSIGIPGVIDLLESMKVAGASSKVQEAEAVGTFGEFFLGELWDTFRSHLGL